MFPDNAHISLGIAPDAAAIVLQPVIPNSYGRRFGAKKRGNPAVQQQ